MHSSVYYERKTKEQRKKQSGKMYRNKNKRKIELKGETNKNWKE
jgi:hypothetical protein